MLSEAVTFELAFPAARRQLQSTSTSELSATFQAQVAAAVAASLSIGAGHVVVAPSASGSRTLTVSIVNLAGLSLTPTQIHAAASAGSFVSGLASTLGVTVAMAKSPAVLMRTTDVPSPPPSTPPPPAPPTTPLNVGDVVQNLAATTTASSQNLD